MSIPKTLARRAMGEWTLKSHHPYRNPFSEVVVEGIFTSPGGKTFTIPGFYDGQESWRVRFNPFEVGQWSYQIASQPADAALALTGTFEVTPDAGRGFLRATPGQDWGFQYESGEPVFILGDTVYELFGMAHCGTDVLSFLQRRANQGFNLLRVRLSTGAFQSVGDPQLPPADFKHWHTRSTWPWGGSEQAPRFDCFNLDYFHTVDAVMRQAETLGINIELIMEAWGNEFPFNSRQIFVPEWEAFWMRYLIARYDGFPNVAMWTLMNEYEYYPNGDWHYKPVADHWAMRVGRWVKSVAQHGHPIAVHNGPREPVFADRFRLDPEAVDVLLFQEWGTRGEQDGWLAAGIEEQIERSLAGWSRSAIFAEWGYERNPELPNLAPHHEFCGPEHTRRGAWRGAFCGLGLIHGFENSWGLFPLQGQDQPGLEYLLHLRRFFEEIVPFQTVRPAPQLIAHIEQAAPGTRPDAMANASGDIVVVYLPVGGSVSLDLPKTSSLKAEWFDPRTAERRSIATVNHQNLPSFSAPTATDGTGHPLDWVLVLRMGN